MFSSGKERAGDAHLVEIRVGGERLQAGVLILPAEATDARRTVGLEHRHHDRRSPYRGRLRVADREQSLVGDHFDEACAQSIGRDAEGADVVLERDALDDVRMRRAGMDERAAERLEETSRLVETAGAVLGDLARAAGDDVLMTLAATLRVVGRPETVAMVSTSSKMKRLSLNDRSGTTLSSSMRIEGADPAGEAVGAVVETGRRFR